MSYVPANSVVGLAMYDPCTGLSTGLVAGCPAGALASTIIIPSQTGSPSAVLIAKALMPGNTTSVLQDGDHVNVYDLTCAYPQILTTVGTTVVWGPAPRSVLLQPSWLVVSTAPGSSFGSPLQTGQSFVLQDLHSGKTVCVSRAGHLVVDVAAPSPNCPTSPLTPVVSARLNAAYFVAASPAQTLTQTWVLPHWVQLHFPEWYIGGVPGWWPSWYVPVLPPHPMPPPPMPRPPYPPPPRPPIMPVPGSDRDSHGCIPSAGYSWCPTTRQCIRPWETPCPGAPIPPPVPGSGTDVHGCRPSAGETWCATKQRCIQPWRESCTAPNPTPGVPGSGTDVHGCRPSAGETWCPTKQRCIQPWRESCTAPNPTPGIPGSGTDVHGCRPSAGETWCATKQRCIQPWRESCTAPNPNPGPRPGPTPGPRPSFRLAPQIPFTPNNPGQGHVYSPFSMSF